MKYIAELVGLEKKSDVKLAYCDYIADCNNDTENIRTRILFDAQSGKYYYHQMQHGKVTKCFEIALSWKPFGKFYIFNFTPDDLHIYEIDSRMPEEFEIKNLEENLIKVGMKCEYDGMTVEFESENSLKFNGKSVPVVPDKEFTFKLLKTKISAAGGAKGLYRFLENIAANGNFIGFHEDIHIGDFALMSYDRSNWLAFKRKYVM